MNNFIHYCLKSKVFFVQLVSTRSYLQMEFPSNPKLIQIPLLSSQLTHFKQKFASCIRTKLSLKEFSQSQLPYHLSTMYPITSDLPSVSVSYQFHHHYFRCTAITIVFHTSIIDRFFLHPFIKI